MKTWTDVYKLPMKMDYYGGYIFDSRCQMMAQFVGEMEEDNSDMFDCITKKYTELDAEFEYRQRDQMVLADGEEVISIRGYGYLTGVGGLKLPHDEAAKIQDEFGQYIVDKLNGKQ